MCQGKFHSPDRFLPAALPQVPAMMADVRPRNVVLHKDHPQRLALHNVAPVAPAHVAALRLTSHPLDFENLAAHRCTLDFAVAPLSDDLSAYPAHLLLPLYTLP